MSTKDKFEAFEVVTEGAVWPLVRLEGSDEPRILDIVLAERLGYANPLDIRKLVRRLLVDRILNESELLATVAKSGGRPAKQYWLNEEQALLVTTQSKTERAIALLKTVVRVFTLARQGKLPGQMAAFDVEAFFARLCNRVEGVMCEKVESVICGKVNHALEQMSHRVAALENKPVASLSPREQWGLQTKRELLASLRVIGKLSPNIRSANRWVMNLIETASNWHGSGCKLSLLPPSAFPDVIVALDNAIKEASKAADKERTTPLWPNGA